MFTRNTLRLSLLTPVISLICTSPALAHVKWFLSRSEDELLAQPKPDLFNKLSLANGIPITLAFLVLLVSTNLANRWKNVRLTRILNLFARRHETELNCFLGVTTGLSFIYCGYSKFLCAPDFVICSHCPQWLPYAEYAIGISLLLGILSRVGGVALIGLLVFTFIKHTIADCLDLLPLYGIGAYFLLVGRGRYSLDFLLKLDAPSGPIATKVAYQVLRVTTGLGLMILGVDEKLINPQLALDVLKYRPELDFMRAEDVTNAMFVLCAGLSELLVGLVIAIGSFPRLASLFVFAIFIATTFVFGSSELFGHLAYYGVLVQLLVKGHGQKVDWIEAREAFLMGVKEVRHQTLRALPQLTFR